MVNIIKFSTAKQLINTDQAHEASNLNQVHQDFYELFTSSPNKDMLKYAYMVDNTHYDDLITKNPDYYLFRNEVAIIKDNASILTQEFEGIEEIIEIGPGSGHVLESKTIPLLSYCSQLKKYIAIDISLNYLMQIKKFFKETTHYYVAIKQADLLNGKIDIFSNNNHRAILFLGSTIGNFDIEQRIKCMEQISNIANSGDKLIMTFDLNHDTNSLDKAYNHTCLKELIQNILRYYGQIDNNFKEHIGKFEVHPFWNKLDEAVEFYLTANKTFSYQTLLGNIQIFAGQKFNVAKSRKFNLEKIQALLSYGEFDLKNQLYCDNIVTLIAIKR